MLHIDKNRQQKIEFSHGGIHVATFRHTPHGEERWEVHHGSLKIPGVSRLLRAGESHNSSLRLGEDIVHKIRIGTPTAITNHGESMHRIENLPWCFVIAGGPIRRHNDDNRRYRRDEREFGIEHHIGPPEGIGQSVIGGHKSGYIWRAK